MGVYVVLFRGVGGATQLPTAPLRAALTEAGFEDVATYINSGNAVLRSARPRDETVEAIAKICAERFGFAKAVYAIPREGWARLIRNNPFEVEAGAGKFLHAAWLAETPEKQAVGALESLSVDGDGFAVVGDVAYLSTPRGFSKSRLAERFDKLIGVPNTARNWNTVLKLMELAERLG
ncbi:DUF1697 domain-containing protein [Chelatococcus sambhunathii]|uniref:DUF1697 domain-containing protein n=1 Tax=Chelatococcus sambhunathii TaxID=363953 RepID=A0ABU1DBV1_9HYPH|nr:DUF1697 domain-containing protein [Chelatococcus sambhunathii]MDR4305592.1 DUF1697 domain-containing protein [Chelatococcus sambhunathii]